MILGRLSEIIQVPGTIGSNFDGGSTRAQSRADVPTPADVYLVVDRFTLSTQHPQLGMPTLYRPLERQPILIRATVSPAHWAWCHVACLTHCTALTYASERAA